MRHTLISGLAVLMVAACGQGGQEGDPGSSAAGGTPAAPAAETPEGPAPGLWRVTTRMSGMPAGMQAPAIETCIREPGFETPQGTGQTEGMDCDQPSFRREQDAMVGRMVCTSPEGQRTVTDMRITGDLSRRYTMEMTTETPPDPGLPGGGMTMVLTAERLGDCPADAAP